MIDTHVPPPTESEEFAAARVMSFLRQLLRTRRLVGVDPEDLVQECMCRLVRLWRTRSAILADRTAAAAVAGFVWKEALRRRHRENTRAGDRQEPDHIATSCGVMQQWLQAEQNRDLRVALRCCMNLTDLEDAFLSLNLSGNGIEAAGALLHLSPGRSYYLRERILRKLRTSVAAQSLITGSREVAHTPTGGAPDASNRRKGSPT